MGRRPPREPPPEPRLPPLQPPPWTPFGPGDNATPDVNKIVQDAEAAIAELRAAQVKLTRMRDGPGPDDTDPPVGEVSRADGQWPFLLIRHAHGDTGTRPLEGGTIAAIDYGEHDSPDIMFTSHRAPTDPEVIGRDGWPALRSELAYMLESGFPYDVWVHVWNLGQTPATGVRVRVWLETPSVFLGGRHLDLGDRLSDRAHLIVKAASYTPGSFGEPMFPMVLATAECISDVASGDRSPGMDRHTGHRRIQIAPSSG